MPCSPPSSNLPPRWLRPRTAALPPSRHQEQILHGSTAAALARPGSLLEVCIDEHLCNPEDPASTFVGDNYGSSIHPLAISWSVLRQTRGSWEGLAGGTLNLECRSERSMIRVEVDGEGDATVTRTP